MKLILSLLGVVLLVVAAVYFLMPADQLPSFFPGHTAGDSHVTPSMASLPRSSGVVLLAAGAFMGRR